MMFYVVVGIVVLVVIGLELYFERKQVFGSGSSESAFGRLATADQRVKDAQGKIIAIQDSLQVKQDAVVSLPAQADAIHAQHDELSENLDDLHAKLG